MFSGRTRLSDRLERGGFDENRVVVGRTEIADNNGKMFSLLRVADEPQILTALRGSEDLD